MSSPRELPILFSTPLVPLVMDGSKTVTRRLVKPKTPWREGLFPQHWVDGVWRWSDMLRLCAKDGDIGRCPYGQPGDLLYVRETWAPMCRLADPQCWCEDENQHYTEWKADTGNPAPGEWPTDDPDRPRWRPSIHMPKRLARTWLRVESVDVGRVSDVDDAEAVREGFGDRAAFLAAIEGMYGPGNPWVWVIEYDVVSTTGREGVGDE